MLLRPRPARAAQAETRPWSSAAVLSCCRRSHSRCQTGRRLRTECAPNGFSLRHFVVDTSSPVYTEGNWRPVRSGDFS